jgi:hypothetical protein
MHLEAGFDKLASEKSQSQLFHTGGTSHTNQNGNY